MQKATKERPSKNEKIVTKTGPEINIVNIQKMKLTKAIFLKILSGFLSENLPINKPTKIPAAAWIVERPPTKT